MEINTKGSGTVGKAVTSDTRRPGLEYSHHVAIIHCYTEMKTMKKNKEKEAGNGRFF